MLHALLILLSCAKCTAQLFDLINVIIPISRPTDATCDRFFFLKTVPQTDTNTETGGCMYGEGLLMMSA
jgi:hypothetical protein